MNFYRQQLIDELYEILIDDATKMKKTSKSQKNEPLTYFFDLSVNQLCDDLTIKSRTDPQIDSEIVKNETPI